MPKGDMSFSITPEEITSVDIMRGGDYRYASMTVKKGEKEFMRVSYEWQGDGVPDFVMGLMQYMQSNKEQAAKNTESLKEELQQAKERLCRI